MAKKSLTGAWYGSGMMIGQNDQNSIHIMQLKLAPVFAQAGSVLMGGIDVRQNYGEAPNLDPIVEHRRIDGHVVDNVVEFTLPREKDSGDPRDQFHFHGRLSACGNMITGRWSHDQASEMVSNYKLTPQTHFMLMRSDDAQPLPAASKVVERERERDLVLANR